MTDPSDTPENAESSTSEPEMRTLEDHGGTPTWASEDPEAAVRYFKTGWTRAELQTLIGEQVGFDHDPEHDRLRKEELAQILVFVLALRGQL